MKTTLIQIDPHDDLTSIKDKMTWAKSSRMLLFFPNGYPLDQSPLTMKLIRRYAETNGARVALVTRNRIMREIAEEQGILCFTSAPQAEKKTWQKPKEKISQRTIQGAEHIIKQKNGITISQKKKSPVRVQRIITVFILMTLLVIASVLFIPSAHITFFPELTLQEMSFKVMADPSVNTIIVNGNIPAQKTTIGLSGELAGDSSGKVSIPKSKANGEVELVNLTAKSVILARGTIVSTGGTTPIEFYLTTDISLPGSTNEAQSAPIEAVMAGAGGNVSSESIIHISGFEQSVSITNLLPTSGGFEQSYPTPTDLDYEKLESQLRDQLLTKCKNEIKDNVSEGERLLEPSVGLDEIISKSQTPKIGEPSDRAILSLEIECSALVIKEIDENQLAKVFLDQDLPPGYLPVDNQILIERTSPITKNSDGLYSWNVNAYRKLMQSWDLEKVMKMISGKGIGEASGILSSAFMQINEAKVIITPQWWKYLPILPGKIEVEFRSD
jgi:hypothetical protein